MVIKILYNHANKKKRKKKKEIEFGVIVKVKIIMKAENQR